MLNTRSDLLYWRGSAIIKGQSQEFVVYNYVYTTVFKLDIFSTFETNPFFKEIAPVNTSSKLDFIVESQKSLLNNLALFSYTLFDDSAENVSCGYSLRIIYQPASSEAKATTEICLLARVASNSAEEIASIKNKQADYIESSLRSQVYQFERIDVDQPDSQPVWLNSIQAPYCYEILKPEEVFQWLEADQKYFYSPGKFQVNKGNDMVTLLEQLQGYKQAVCIDITLVPTKVESYEKNTISRYIEALSTAARGIPEEKIAPNSNAKRAKSVYEEIQKKYGGGVIFLYSFRVFSPCQDTCQNVANQLAATSTAPTISPLILQVSDKKYASETALQVNINYKVCVSDIWDIVQNRLDGFQGGPETIRRLHRLIDLEEASAFFRLPVPLKQSYPGIKLNTKTNQDIIKIEDIIKKYGELVTEDRYIVGIDQNGNPCVSDLSNIAHRLIAGVPGSGKTNFINSVIYQFLYTNLKNNIKREIYIADFKEGLDFYRIAKSHYNVNLVTEFEGLLEVLNHLIEKYKYRLQQIKNEDVENLKELRQKFNSQEHRIILIIDEAASILDADRKTKESINNYLRTLTLKARATDINIFYCTQQPTTDVIESQVLNNMDERVIFRVQSTISTRLLDDDMASNLPVNPKGRAIYRDLGGYEPELKTIATPYVSKEAWMNLLT